MKLHRLPPSSLPPFFFILLAVLPGALPNTKINNLIYSCDSLTQPVLAKEGESIEKFSTCTPSVYLIGSRNNVAMYANTPTFTTRIANDDGNLIILGRTYLAMLNVSTQQSHTCSTMVGQVFVSIEVLPFIICILQFCCFHPTPHYH